MIIWKDITKDSVFEEGVKYLVQYEDGKILITTISGEDIISGNNKKIKYSTLNTKNPKLNATYTYKSYYGDGSDYDWDQGEEKDIYYRIDGETIKASF